MRLDHITPKRCGSDTFTQRRVRFPSEEEPRGTKTSTLLLPTSLPGGQSKREPPDPIPTSEVKPLSADDSADYLCESRELPGSNCKNPRLIRAGVFLCASFNRTIGCPNTAPYIISSAESGLSATSYWLVDSPREDLNGRQIGA